MENLQKFESHGKKFKSCQKILPKDFLKIISLFYIKTLLLVIIFVRFFALANWPCQPWTKVIFSCLSLLLFGLDQKLGGRGASNCWRHSSDTERDVEEAVTLTIRCQNIVPATVGRKTLDVRQGFLIDEVWVRMPCHVRTRLQTNAMQSIAKLLS